MFNPMPQPTLIHSSSRNERLIASLQSRSIHPSLHYETAEQARKWLEIHRKHSPAIRPDTIQIYRDATSHVASLCATSSVQVISLGCGGGNKDMLLLQSLIGRECRPHYFPCDISGGLVQEASVGARALSSNLPCTPVVCDLEHSARLASFLLPLKSPETTRIFLFFGILPNMEPSMAAACLRALLHPGDHLLVSANLAPGTDANAGTRRVLPQYDNPETRDWLLTLIHDLGLSPDAGILHFRIEPSPDQASLRQIVAVYEFKNDSRIRIDQQTFAFKQGDTLRLFFSNRYTPALAQEFAGRLKVPNVRNWINVDGDEAVLAGIAQA